MQINDGQHDLGDRLRLGVLPDRPASTACTSSAASSPSSCSSPEPRWASSRLRRPPPRSWSRTTGTSSTWCGSDCSPSSTSSDEHRPSERRDERDRRTNDAGPRCRTRLRAGRLGHAATTMSPPPAARAPPAASLRACAAGSSAVRDPRSARSRRWAARTPPSPSSSGAADSTDDRRRRSRTASSSTRPAASPATAEPGGRREPGPGAGRRRRRGRRTSRSAPGACRPPARARTIPRKTAEVRRARDRAIAAYVQSIGGGPTIPTGSLRGDAASIAEGGELFRQNCASCHGTTFKGAPLSAGKQAPSLNAATDKQIYTAMLSGPGEHAGVQQQPADRRRRRRRSSPTSRRSRRPTTRAAAASTASARCPRRSSPGSAVSAC